MTRMRAALIHFAVSALIALVLFLLFWFVWYPYPLFQAVGGLTIFLLVLSVDVVLGPLLTFLVFAKEKKSLRIDLLSIAALQLAALLYGMFTLLTARPVYIAALGHRFDLILANEVHESDILEAGVSLPLFSIEWVGTREPTDDKNIAYKKLMTLGGGGIGHLPQFHTPLQQMRTKIRQSAQPVSKLQELNPSQRSSIAAWLNERGLSDSEVRFQGLRTLGEPITIFLDAQSGAVIGLAPFRPWPH